MRIKYSFLLALFLLLIPFSALIFGQDGAAASGETESADSLALTLPAPVTNLKAINTPNDHGHSFTVTWDISADDGGGLKNVLFYRVMRSDNPDSSFKQRGENKLPRGASTYQDNGSKRKESDDFSADFTDFYYRIDAITIDSNVFSSSGIYGPVQSKGEWYNTGRTPVLVAVIIFLILTMIFVALAKKGADLYIRPLAGIEAVDDAIGRATEMGKPILYILGLGGADQIATIASFTILSRVAKQVAEYQTKLIVPCYDPIVMTVAQDIVKSSFMDAGRVDDYKEESVYFVTQSQFAYVAAVNGTMLRELPATNMYMGKFYAESLILAETGALAGSIQISGTDEIAQIPFFVVACDYTLIGEELYAASAYLGKEPILLGSLKGQDMAKAAIIVLMIIGVVTANIGGETLENFRELFKVIN